MRFGSVCSGIEAASVAWNPLGWEAAWLAEIEPFPSAVLKHHYPDVPNLGDMTALPERIRSGEVEAPDLFCGGTPCQAFSVAGKRQSLSDARGNLSLTFCDIADAIDESRSVRGLGAAIVFWENVPGVLSTSDNAFGCFLAQLCGGSEPLYAPDGWPDAGCVSGPSRTAAWRVLDAQYFGLAQRRRRVFVVASAREGFDPAAVLFEFNGLRRDTAPSREKREGLAGTLTAGAGMCGASDNGDPNKNGALIVEGEESHDQPLLPPSVVGALTAKGPEAMGAPKVDGNHYFAVAQPIAWDEELNASIDQAGTLLRGGAGGRHDGVGVPIAFHPTQTPIHSEQICHAIGANENATAAVACDGHAFSVAWSMNLMSPGRQVREDDGVGALTQDAHRPTQGNEAVVIQTAMQVRRLTPVECERLQGFPDGYTAIPWRGKPVEECPDGPRYKALGNSWAVPVVRWIGARIAVAL